jgi:hypothetical protein
MTLQAALSGIELTAHCPISNPMWRANRVSVEIDGKESPGEWTHPHFYPLPPGEHLVRVALHSFMAGRATNEALNSFLSRSEMEAALRVNVADGSVTQLRYSVPATILGMLSYGLNKGRLQITGTVNGTSYAVPMPGAPAGKPSDPDSPVLAKTRCLGCGAQLAPGAKFCPECGRAAAQPGICPKCGQPHGAGKFCSNCGEQLV